MARGTRSLVAWACLTLLTAFVLHADALVLCVASDHTAVEAAHREGACTEGSGSANALGAPEAGCSDTVLHRPSTAPAPDRTVLVVPTLPHVATVAAPPRAGGRRHADLAPSADQRARARASTVLLI